MSPTATLFGSATTAATTGTTVSPSNICTKADSDLVVVLKKKETLFEQLFDEQDYECVGNNRTYKNQDFCNKYFSEKGDLIAIPNDWVDEMNGICIALGDCGGHVNFIGEYTEDGYAAYYNNLRIAGGGGGRYMDETSETQSTSTITGSVIKDILKRMTGGN